MSASKCRNCGSQLDIIDMVDGICSSGKRTGQPTCFGRATTWAAKHRPEAIPCGLDDPKWAIAIDEWLAAGAP